jgi:predicted ribosome quality control (RQC) complex YloA/Tae2 family protein
MYESSNESIKRMFKMIDAKAPELLKQDPYYEFKQTAEQAKAQGLIRKKTQEEIDEELKKKPWLKVNKVIRKNEQLNDADSSL